MKKVALITGARGGIGSAITTALLAQGIASSPPTPAQRSGGARLVREQGFRPDQVRLLALDVADTAMCRDTLADCCRMKGGWTCWSTMPASPGTGPSSG